MLEPQPITEDREERLIRTTRYGRHIRVTINIWAYLGFWAIAFEYVTTSASAGNAPPEVGYLLGLLLGVAMGFWSWIRHDADAVNKEL